MITVIMIIETIVLIILVAGFLVERSGAAPTWEDGIKKVLFFCFRWLHKESTGRDLPEYEINLYNIPSDEEIRGLISALNHEPYEAPNIQGCDTNSYKDVFVLSIQAAGLYGRYENLAGTTLYNFLNAKIRQYFQQNNHPVAFFVHSASEHSCIIIFPINEHGANQYAAWQKEQSDSSPIQASAKEMSVTVKDLEEVCR